jgi:PLP dependent protein
MYQQVLDGIIEAVIKSGRKQEDVTLVAVSKTFPVERILEAYNLGCRDFGENRVQEAIEKIKQCPKDILWHFIGHLQTNKVQKIVDKFHLIHGVDSFKVAEAISRKSKRKNRILLEVNLSGEETKYGMVEKEILEDFGKIRDLENVEVHGLMTMAPWVEDRGIIRRCFAAARHLRDSLEREFSVDLPHLSMGMSHDYDIAIQEGATLLRIGTAIFGKRQQK